jgi:hypothetical protein
VNVHQVSPKKRRQHNAINYKEYDKHGYKKLNSLKNNKKIEELESQEDVTCKKSEI